MANKHWYAVLENREDCDWGTGSDDWDEAVKMACDYGEESIIAEIDGELCIAEYYYGEDFDEDDIQDV